MAAGMRQSFTFYDAKQQRATLSVYMDSATTADATGDAEYLSQDLKALSNSSNAGTQGIRSNGPYTSFAVPVSAGTAATYQDIADKLVIVFQDASGGLHRLSIPCPKSALFLADQETVDFTHADIKQFVADVTHAAFGGTAAQTAHALVSREGDPYTASVGGYRRRGKTPRKFNVFTRNPILTGQGL